MYTDFCAMSVMTRELMIDDEGLPVRTDRGDSVYFWQILGLRRWPLKTPYSEVVKHLVRTVRRPDIPYNIRVSVDMSGVGTSVFEQVRSALSPLKVENYGISVTTGQSWSWNPKVSKCFNVSKVEITSALADALGSERVVICPCADGSPMPNGDVLDRELRAFKIKTTKSGYQSAEAFNSDHDDCVMSISMNLWLGSRRFIWFDASEARGRTVSWDVLDEMGHPLVDEGNPDRLAPHERTAVKAEHVSLKARKAAAMKARQEKHHPDAIAEWRATIILPFVRLNPRSQPCK
jgi:hypothetical protein